MGATVAGAGALAWLTALSVYDIRQRRLPNALTLPGAAIVIVVAGLIGRGLPAVLGSLALTVLYVAVHLVAPSAMGAGDVKLALGVGALTGAFGVDAWLLALVGASLLTALWGVVAWRSRHALPHGASMSIAAVAAVALVAV